MQVEGETPKEPVDIITNSAELVINAVERNYTSGEANAEGFAEELPEGYEFGNPWDNQFFIASNREFEANEETVLEFDYYIISDDITEAKVTSQGQGEPGAYIGGGAGDITFTTTEQHWKADFKVPEKTGVKSVAFNMAEIKPACTYVIKNVRWYLKGADNENDKTMENLINATGTDNFYVKIKAGTNPYKYGGEDGINSLKANTVNNGAIFNLAGQKVDENYKGLVIKSGKKLIQK
jgi:hypothetical protein